MLTSPLQEELYQISFTRFTTITLSLGLSIATFSLMTRSQLISRSQAGALILAANCMGIAAPTIEALYSPPMTSIPLHI